jgi:type IV pilus assembly protein PilB
MLGERLLVEGLIDASQLDRALAHQRESNLMLGEILVTLGFVTRAQIAPFLKEATGFQLVDLSCIAIDTELAASIPESLARRKRVLPFSQHNGVVRVAMADPLDLAAIDELQGRLRRRIAPFLSLQSDIEEAIGRIFSGGQTARLVLQEFAASSEPEATLSVDELLTIAEGAPVVRLVNSIVQSAIGAGASDVHIEPQETTVRVRFRQDGVLYDQMLFARSHLPALVSRVKVMADLDISEHRKPQDGRFVFRSESDGEYDVRVSLLPLIHGEKIVMRLLEKSCSVGSTTMLGLFEEQRELFENMLRRPHGIVLVTGPTGSGKSTTLYAALRLINDSTRNINTVEDPVEYQLPGVNQVQVRPQTGLTFAAGLRSLVRQDPDVIMVGEIRDLETAEIAVQAALTGHLVLSTLHTNDAPGALIRLQNMGVEPFLISSALIGVVAQRLLRTVCPHCSTRAAAPPYVLDALGVTAPDGETPMLVTATGCNRCGGRGMRGRTGAYEIMPMSDALRSLALKGASGPEIRAQAIAEGMATMRDAAFRKLLAGLTTFEEVTRVLFAEDF